MEAKETFLSAGLAILAGSDTTSSTTSNILYFLISHPAAYKRLQAEVDGLGDKLTECSAQAQLPYLNAVMFVASESPNCLCVQRCVIIVTKPSGYYPLSCLA